MGEAKTNAVILIFVCNFWDDEAILICSPSLINLVHSHIKLCLTLPLCISICLDRWDVGFFIMCHFITIRFHIYIYILFFWFFSFLFILVTSQQGILSTCLLFSLFSLFITTINSTVSSPSSRTFSFQEKKKLMLRNLLFFFFF